MRIILILMICSLFAASVGAQKKMAASESAPPFSVNSLAGETFSSATTKNKVVVLNLWFVNCPNCLAEIKLLNKIVAEYKNQDVLFIALATNKKAELEKFLKKNPFDYHIVPNAMQTILSFGEPDQNGEINIPFPMHIVIDRDGKIVVRKSGIKGLDNVKNELKLQFDSAAIKAK